MDSDVEAAMVVHKCDGTTIKFKEFENGLYYHDAAEGVTSSNNKITHSYSHPANYGFITTVAIAKERLFTQREVEALHSNNLSLDSTVTSSSIVPLPPRTKPNVHTTSYTAPTLPPSKAKQLKRKESTCQSHVPS